MGESSMTAAVAGGGGWVDADARTKLDAKPTEMNERMYRVINAIIGNSRGEEGGGQGFSRGAVKSPRRKRAGMLLGERYAVR